jgi:hypothetical protein
MNPKSTSSSPKPINGCMTKVTGAYLLQDAHSMQLLEMENTVYYLGLTALYML